MTTLIPRGVPARACRTFYKAGRHSGYIYTWRDPVRPLLYYWEANGNNGCETNGEAAMERAKRWIRDGQ